MLPNNYRLKKRTAFNATYRTGKSIHKNGITVFCGRKKKNNETTKIGFVVSKKVHKRAVKRNRIKRLMRESIRLHIKNSAQIDNCKYLSLIFVANSKLLDKNFSEVNSSMELLLEKLLND